MKITTVNCTLVDWTSRAAVHGTPPVPIYRIIVTYQHPSNPRDDQFTTIELISNDTYRYTEAEKIRDGLTYND